jgi:uncharacterized protein YqhQ
MCEEHFFGGQAVVEGCLMKGKEHITVAVRKPDKSIKVKLEKYTSLTKSIPLLGKPFLRGIIILFEMIVMGMKALTWSANESVDEEEEKLTRNEIILTVTLSFIFSILIFVIAPYAITTWFGIQEESRSILFNVVDGIVKIAIFLGYIAAIGMMHDVKRIFQYHGAEHKSITCFENKKALTVKNVQSFSAIHPRCGTSFILLVITTGIIIFSVVPDLVAWLFPAFKSLQWSVRRGILLLVRIIFMVPVAGISYEVLKLAGKYKNSIFLKAIVYPGMLMQKLTTQPPSDDQVEVAIAGLKKLLKAEKVKEYK